MAASTLAATPPGELVCQHDSFLRELEAVVVSCVPASLEILETGSKSSKEGKPKPQSRKGDNVVSSEASTASTDTDRLYEVVLTDSVLFPLGGGQPDDRGSTYSGHLQISGVPVHRVLQKDGQCVHLVPEPLPVGKKVHIELDWDRRFDHMQQHSAQHLITAMAIKLFGIPTTSWSLSTTRSNLELKSPNISTEQISLLEDKVNAEIREASPVKARWIDVENGNNELDSVRTTAAKGSFKKMRVVEIAGLDENTCCGTHVRHLGQLQAIKLLYTETARGCTRVFFVAGERVRQTMQRSFLYETSMVNLLSAGPEEHKDRVEKMMTSQRQNAKTLKALYTELATLCGQQLLSKAKSEKKRLVSLHREDVDVSFLSTVASVFSEDDEGRNMLLLATAGKAPEGMVLLCGPVEAVNACGPKVATALEAKGGGKKGKYQAKAKSFAKRPELLVELEEYLANGGGDAPVC